ncbi:MAG TPA: DUF3617 domain-containing protein [Rhizomicrobium sp.]|nr:DUF3617 domain-containing protein [Rhizomicrobium sp.]
MRQSISSLAAVAAMALAATTATAFADHGKVGLWQVTTTASMHGMAPHKFSSEQCMTESEVKSDKPPAMEKDSNCKMTGEHMTANSFAADMVCSGPTKGTGHMSVVYDGDTHYSGQMTMAMNAGGRAMNMTNTFDGKWVSADCGKAAH